MKTIDCFIWTGERELLEIRLHELNKYVDYFVIQDETDNDSAFENIKPKISEFLDKIRVVRPRNYPDEKKWNILSYGLKDIPLEDTDIILISKVNEIPHGLAVESLCAMAKDIPNFMAVSIEMIEHPYYANVRSHLLLTGTVGATIKTVKNYTFEQIRNDRAQIVCLSKAGWCFESFERKPKMIKDGESYICFDNVEKESYRLKTFPLEFPNLPTYLIENKEKFKDLFY